MKRWIVSAIILAVPNLGWSYPTYIAKGYTNCGTCHYNPTGGGLANSYGHAAQSSTFPDSIDSQSIESLRKTLTKNDVTGYREDKSSAFQWDAGADIRLLALTAYGGSNEGEGGGKELTVIPMLLEAGGAMAYGPWMLYGTVTPRRTGADKIPNSIFSREHWIGRRLGEEAMVRGGRFVLPFGIRSPDHTLYTQEDFRLDKWDQSYGIEWDRYTERWMLSAAGFVGDLLHDPPERQERGGVGSVAYNFTGKASVGISFLGSYSKFTDRLAGSLFGRVRFLKKCYSMAEFSSQGRRSSEGLGSETELASFLRLGVFPIESLDVYAEMGEREILSQSELRKFRTVIGAQWHILPWIELIPAVVVERFNSRNEVTPLGQFHMVF